MTTDRNFAARTVVAALTANERNVLYGALKQYLGKTHDSIAQLERKFGAAADISGPQGRLMLLEVVRVKLFPETACLGEPDAAKQCASCGASPAAYYPPFRLTLCDGCLDGRQIKVSREEFDLAYWGVGYLDVPAITRREFYDDYLHSIYDVPEYIAATRKPATT